MLRDHYLKAFFIPLLGIMLPLVSGIITYNHYSWPVLLAANVYFIFTSLLIWAGCNWIHGKLRSLYRALRNPFNKIAVVCLASGLYGACVGSLSTLGWLRISKEAFAWNNFLKFVLASVAAVIIFTLVYEILFLSKERELDNKIVDQLDRERSQAELTALRNEMDPHFIFNSLNTLNHLILNNPSQAHLYNNKLAQVYKYFLLNKNRELISLKNELEFIDDYFFLLQLRHDNKLKLETHVSHEAEGTVMIPPCSLQLLVENAIKHNEFSNDNPLLISIVLNNVYVKVTNNMRPKPYPINSTNIGLKNLSSRYKLLCNKDITIERDKESFTVKLPFIRQ
jgi:hypothetical protein